MDFTPTEDRRMIGDSLRRYLAEQYPIEHRNKVAYEGVFHDPAKWAELAELGILGALVTEDDGGFGGAGFDITTVFEEMGRAICAEPMLGNLMALRLYAALGESERVEAIIAGAERAAFGFDESDAYGDLDEITTTADGDTLTGRKTVVYGGNSADFLLIAAKSASGALGLYEVAASDAEVLPYAMIDGAGAAEIILDKAKARCLAEDARAAIEAALDAGRVALCAEAVGAMDVLKVMTKDYLMQRQQFGRPIALFQALQHRLVDFSIEIEQARSITIHAAARLDSEDAKARALAVAQAKNLIGRASKLVAEEAVQMHGGIGMTWEYAGSHYAKRLIMIDHQLGDTEDQLRTAMALSDISEPA
ncbi:acyl-CoA dehydrogenase domain protein [Maricaulis maris MCS10]|uniref:Acyl-CoA dehydrogenase domain protein n=1 Tax=Maricaulis maris (strain MCS10) TaxID=394221 RepID=Q0ALM7_MARMM|nr:acyl-CoA dehydrogenase [Maricaulis maris]ABI66816.1 acyl-CoA dehydrogenase domain protein [Maricaulis maris MCS10]